MKKKMMLGAIFLLTGCPGPGDRMVERESTTAFIKDKQVCVVSPLEPQERITAIQINSDKSNSLNKVLMTSLFMFQKVSAFLCSGLSSQLENVTISPVMFNLINQCRI
ncbi:hypothetical protein SB912_15130 [Pantoea sp. SIMBA_072]